MDTVIGDCDSASSGEDERMQRHRRYAIPTVKSAVAEACISDNSSYAPRRRGSVPERAPSRDRQFLHQTESYYEGAVNVAMDYFNRLNSVILPRSEPECEGRYRMPRRLYESVQARVLEMDAYYRP
jgi:hypothetical protein